MQNIQLSSDRLYLREVEPTDLAKIYDITKRDDVVRYTLMTKHTQKDAQNYVEQTNSWRLAMPRTEFVLAIIIRNSHQLVGLVDLSHDEKNRSAEIGYYLHPNFRHRGYAFEAVKSLINFAFDQLHSHRVFAKVDPKNITSKNLLKKLGFLFEGELRDHLWVKSMWRSSQFFSLLEDEWKNSNESTAKE